MKSPETVDIGIIGTGPRGISLGIAAQDQGARVVNFECNMPARNWQQDRMSPRIALHPLGWEITANENFSFDSYYDSQVSTRDKKRYPLEQYDGSPQVVIYRRYLKWLSEHLHVQNSNVTNIELQPDGTQHVTHMNDHGESNTLNCRSVVVATGMIGHGGAEFAHDPTNLVGKSNRVVHIPTQLESRRDIAEFLHDVKDVAIIGSGIAGARPFWVLKDLPHIRNIQVASTSGVVYDSDSQVWTQDTQGEYVSALRSHDSRNIRADKRVEYYLQRVIGAEEKGKKITLVTDQGSLPEVDAVLVATGYRYDATKIPCLTSYIKNGVIAIDGRHPELDTSYQSTHSPNAGLYFTGEAAVKSMGPQQRWLASSIPTSGVIVHSISEVLKAQKRQL